MSLRVILITGANGFIGQAIAREFLAESPDNVVWLGIHTHQDRAAQLVKEHSDRCRTILLDVTSRESWRDAVARIQQRDTRLDALVNNAGKHEDALLGLMSFESWEHVRDTNLDSVFHGCQAVLPTMIQQRSGRIVNISSLSALIPPAGQTNYAAAKAGVVALTQSLAKEVARLNITVNAVCPGFVETEALTSMSPEDRANSRMRIPMRRFGRPEEVAKAVRFLASDDASYITGSILKVDGGVL